MTDSILNYSKNKELESLVVNELSDKLYYLMGMRREMVETLVQMDEMINEILKEMHDVGIEVY
jgi:hypothetical protein